MLTDRDPSQFRPIAAEQYASISERVCQMRYETSHQLSPARARLFGVQIDSVSLAHYESCGLEHGIRTQHHIRANPQDFFILCLPLQARFQFAHAGLETEVNHGSAVLLTAQRPFEAYVSSTADDGWHSSLQVRIPASLLRSRVPHVDRLCNQAISVASGAGWILQSALLACLEHAPALSSAQARHHSSALADMIAACITDLGVGQPASVASIAAAESAFHRAMSFIECQLSAANLDTELVAQHCRVSTRYLHKIFSQRSLTVAGQIRELRLQRCHQALQDERMSHRTVIDIAYQWGFSDPSHFGRLYRKRFGVSPRQGRSVVSTVVPS